MNILVLKGNITKDIELSYLPSQVEVAKFGLAVNKKYKDKDKTLFIDCVAFKETAKNINKYFHKGSSILVSGELVFEQWDSKDGQKRSKHTMTVERFDFLDKAKKDDYQEPEDVEPKGLLDEESCPF